MLDWDEVKDKLILVLEQILTSEGSRAARQRAQTVVEALSDLDSSAMNDASIRPGKADIFMFPEVQSIVLNDSAMAEFSKESFHELAARLPEFTIRWREQKERELFASRRPQFGCQGSLPSHEEILQALSQDQFHCGECQKDIGYPEVLMHPCCTKFTWARLSNEFWWGEKVHLKTFLRCFTELPFDLTVLY